MIEQFFEKEKKQAALFSIISNTCLIILKLFAGVISGSIGIISEAIHSGSDLLASFIAYFSVSESAKPADKEHQFGHGKYEDLAGLTEGALIILAAFYIIYESVKKILHHSGPEMDVNLGLIVMFISVVANFFVSNYLFKIAKKTDSAALFADGEHLRTDIYSSLAVFIGLLLIKITGNPVYDPIIAIAVALIIFLAGWRICEKSRKNLLDGALSKNEISQIQEIIYGHLGDEIISLKSMRTRKSGIRKNIDLVLVAKRTTQIGAAHQLCDAIEHQIEERIKNTDITIHIEPNE